MNKWFHRITIKQKLWAGFAVQLSILLLVVSINLSGMSETRQSVSAMARDIQPTLIASMQLKNVLKEASTSLGFYLLTGEDYHKNNYQSYLEKSKQATQELARSPLALKDTELLSASKEIEQAVDRFISYQGNMVELVTVPTKNFHALRYAADNLNPISRDMLQSISNMLLAENQEEVSEQRRQLLMKLSDLRYTWNSVQNNMRTYLFYGNDDAYSNIELFVEGAGKIVSDLENNFSEIFTFEQEEGLPVVKDGIALWRKRIVEVKNIQKGDKARMDAFLIKSEIGPLLQKIDKKLNSLVEQQRNSTEQMGELILGRSEATSELVLVLLGIGFLFGGLVAWGITKLIVTPINLAAHAMRDIADGDGDLTRRLHVNSDDELGKMSAAFNKFAEKTHHTIQQVNNTIIELANSSNQLRSETTLANQTVTKQRQETEHIATAVTQMSATSLQVAKHIEMASSAAQQVEKESADSQEVVSKALQGMRSLADKTADTASIIQKLGADIGGIGEIVEVIKSVTEQTNLLALNAAIEAARAGEQGRGFAVVADEVRTLADRTKQSTIDISQRMDGLVSVASLAVEGMDSNHQEARRFADLSQTATESLQSISVRITEIKDMMYQIACAAEQQSVVADEIQANVVNVSELAEDAAKSANGVAKSGASLESVADNLGALVGKFKI